MPEAQVNGVRLYYEEHGDGRPIACIHGGGSTAMMWAALLVAASESPEVLSFIREVLSGPRDQAGLVNSSSRKAKDS